MYFEVQQLSNWLLVSWHNIELFPVLPEKRRLLHVAAPALRHNLESLCGSLVAMPLCFSYFSGALATNHTSLTSWVCRIAMLKLVLLTIGAFHQTVCHGVVPRYASARMRYNIDRLGMIGPLCLHCWKLTLSVGLFRLMEESDDDLIQGLLLLARPN